MKRVSQAFAILLIYAMTSPTGAGPLEDGFAAAQRGDHATAAKWYRSAAEQGDPGAQFNLGVMYINSLGVPQDMAEAGKWFLLAAEQGDAQAQANLGWLYEQGAGVPQDFVEAHNWYSRAAASLPDGAARLQVDRSRQRVAARMSPTQIAKAQNEIVTPTQQTTVAQKQDIRGAKPGMTVAQAFEAVQRNDGRCGDARNNATREVFIQDKNPGLDRLIGVTPYHQQGFVYCEFSSGMNLGGSFRHDHLLMETTMSRVQPKADWPRLKDATILNIRYVFYSALSHPEMVEVVLQQFGKTHSDLQKDTKGYGTGQGRLGFLSINGTRQPDNIQLDLGDGILMGIRAYPQNTHELRMSKDQLVMEYLAKKDAERQATSPRPKF